MAVLMKEAKHYADRGWKVFPVHAKCNSVCSCNDPKCAHVAAHPRIDEWRHRCSRDSFVIERWWNEWPDANIGIATGDASGFFVLDIDPRSDKDESVQELLQQNANFPKTLCFKNDDGSLHLLFKMPTIAIASSQNILPGMNVRGNGAFIVAPSHPRNRTCFSWVKESSDNHINEAPTWLLYLLFNQLFLEAMPVNINRHHILSEKLSVKADRLHNSRAIFERD